MVEGPPFAPGKVVSHELGIEPYSFVTLNYSTSNFLLCLTLGGVFERFPGLVFGAIKVGASWFGPFVESLDMWADVYAARLEPFISSRPSEYMRRNVRVTPFNNFEPVSEHLTRYPHLQDCYAFSTDSGFRSDDGAIRRTLPALRCIWPARRVPTTPVTNCSSMADIGGSDNGFQHNHLCH